MKCMRNCDVFDARQNLALAGHSTQEVVFHCKDGEYRTSSSLLLVSSDYLRDLLTFKKQTQQGEYWSLDVGVAVSLPDASIQQMETLMEFIGTGSVVATQRSAKNLRRMMKLLRVNIFQPSDIDIIPIPRGTVASPTAVKRENSALRENVETAEVESAELTENIESADQTDNMDVSRDATTKINENSINEIGGNPIIESVHKTLNMERSDQIMDVKLKRTNQTQSLFVIRLDNNSLNSVENELTCDNVSLSPSVAENINKHMNHLKTDKVSESKLIIESNGVSFESHLPNNFYYNTNVDYIDLQESPDYEQKTCDYEDEDKHDVDDENKNNVESYKEDESQNNNDDDTICMNDDDSDASYKPDDSEDDESYSPKITLKSPNKESTKQENPDCSKLLRRSNENLDQELNEDIIEEGGELICVCQRKYTTVVKYCQHLREEICHWLESSYLACPMQTCHHALALDRKFKWDPVARIRFHLRSRHLLQRDSYMCTLCPKVLYSDQSLRYHTRQHSNPRKFFCEMCEHFFPRVKFENHLNMHSSKRSYVCNRCDKVFSSKKNLDTHKITHANEYQYPCDKCPRKFHQKGNLDVHIKRIHDNTYEKVSHTIKSKYSCNQCDNKFDFKNQLIMHRSLAHTNEKISCEICEKLFLRKENLRKHMLSHTGLPPLLKCSACDKLFYHETFLKRHERIHKKD